jgi:hypothetical protein
MSTSELTAKGLSELIQSDDGVAITDWVDPYNGDGRYHFDGWHDFQDFIDDKDGVVFTDVGTVKLVDNYGGEFLGDELWFVFSVTTPEGTQYFRMDGWYQSFHGGEYDGELHEVTPKEKVVTVYE